MDDVIDSYISVASISGHYLLVFNDEIITSSQNALVTTTCRHKKVEAMI